MVLVAGVAELARWPVPTVGRQVSDEWQARYRGWVYGSGFGLQLGIGVATTVTTPVVYGAVALLVLLGATGELGAAQLGGAAFGLARAGPVLAGGRLHDAEGVRRRVSRVAAAAGASRLAAGSSLCVLALWMARPG